MAIQPRYSQAILSGAKTVEFRKRRLAEDIGTVLIYESSPTQRIVGRFTIQRSVQAPPTDLWEAFAAVGCIDQDSFEAYYSANDHGVALLVADVEQFELPVALDDVPSRPSVPQSFVYLDSDDLREIMRMQSRPGREIPRRRAKRVIERISELVAG